jgi:hypothetical protein
MATLVAMFVCAYNIGHVASLALVASLWLVLQHYWVHEWHARDWPTMAQLGTAGVCLGALARATQQRPFDLRPWYSNVLSSEAKSVGLAVLLLFGGLGSYDDIIQLCVSHDTSAQFPLGKIRALLVCVLMLLFMYVAETKWHNWGWFSAASKVYNTSEGLAAVTDNGTDKRLRSAYLTQATLISLLISGDVLVFQATRNAILDAHFLSLLVVYVALVLLFKLMTSKWHS